VIDPAAKLINPAGRFHRFGGAPRRFWSEHRSRGALRLVAPNGLDILEDMVLSLVDDARLRDDPRLDPPVKGSG